MKQLLSDFCNMLYPKPDNAAWKWDEISWVLVICAVVVSLLVVSKLR